MLHYSWNFLMMHLELNLDLEFMQIFQISFPECSLMKIIDIKYTGKQITKLKSRSQLHDCRMQLFSTTSLLVSGHKLPFFVKLPRISSIFREIPPEHFHHNILRKNSERLFNGMFFMPDKFAGVGIQISPVKKVQLI